MLKVLWSNFRWLTLSLYKKACVYVIASLSNYFKRANYSKENVLLKEKKTNMFERDGDTKFIKILTVRPTVSTIWVEHKNICSKITQQIQIDAQMEKLDEDWNGLNLFILDPRCLRFWLIYVSSGKHCAGVAKIWLFGPRALLSNQNSFSSPVLTLLTGHPEQKSSGVEIGTYRLTVFQSPFLLFVTFNIILGDIVWLCHSQVKWFLKFHNELAWKTKWTVANHDAVPCFGMLRENCKQKNEASGYETLGGASCDWSFEAE